MENIVIGNYNLYDIKKEIVELLSDKSEFMENLIKGYENNNEVMNDIVDLI